MTLLLSITFDAARALSVPEQAPEAFLTLNAKVAIDKPSVEHIPHLLGRNMSAIILCVLTLQEASLSGLATPSAVSDVTHQALQISSEDWLCSQAFSFESLQNGLGFSQNNDWMMADDFYSMYEWDYLFRIEIWAIYAESNPQGILIQIRSDIAGPGSIIESGTSNSLNHQDTGYSQWGYPLWYTDISVSNLEFPVGKSWLALQTTGTGNAYWLAADQQWADMSYFSSSNGGSWSSSQAMWGTPYEQFMVLNRWFPALERNSWGGIKALF